MLKHLIIGILLVFLLCPCNGVAYAREKQESAYRLPPLRIPDIPLDDNPFSREVFSLKELRAGNVALLERIIATRMDFPLMFDPLGEFSRELFPNPDRVRFGKDFLIVIRMSSILWRNDSLTALKALKDELDAQGLDRGRARRDMRIEFLVFLKNYGALREYVADFPGVSDEARRETTGTLEQVYGVCRRVLEFKALTLNGIGTLDQIGENDHMIEKGTEQLRFERFVTESSGMKAQDISSILEIRNPAQFRELCLERTSELLADADKENVEGLLGAVEPSDAIVLASYFARDRIQEYRKPIDQMAGLYDSMDESPQEDTELQVGDCRNFAGLAVHYLNRVVKPNNPKLRHWHFGIAKEDISDYHHAYVTAVHVNRREGKEKIDLFFFDPVALSSRSLGKLRTKDIRRLIDAASKDDHFFHIKRYGEDFVARKSQRKRPLKDAYHDGRRAGEISFDALLSDQ